MSKALSVATFDYSQVDKDTKSKLIALGGQLKRHGDVLRTAGNEIGKAVIEAHELLASQRAGLFDEWVQTETEIGLSTAYNCLNAAKRAIEFPIIGKLPPTVAYMMAGPKVPDAAIKDFEKQIDRGVRPTIEACKATLKRFRTVKPKKSKPAPAEPSKEPDTSPEVAGRSDDGPLNDEPEKELTFEEQVKEANRKIESFCRDLTKYYETNCPKLQSIDHMGRYDSALAQVKAACGTLRTCKYHDEPCPKCSGEGCSKCQKESDFGAVTVLTYRQLAG